MIAGIGIDAVSIDRFEQHAKKTREALNKVFSDEEIDYCLQEPAKSAERFAARFAAKEALYKAVCQANGSPPRSFLQICKASSLTTNPAPQVAVNWKSLAINPYNVYASLTHTDNLAIAHVILEKI